MIVAVIFRFFPGAVRGYEAAAAIHPAPGACSHRRFRSCKRCHPISKILTVPMALRVIRIAETLSASAETRGIDLTRRKSNYLSLRFSAWDVVFCVLLAASIAAGLIL